MIDKLSIEELQGLVEQATAEDSPEVVVDRFLENAEKMIAARPKQYLTYGPYWWAVKKLLIDRGVTKFGTSYDMALARMMGYDNPLHTLLAAWAHQTLQREQGAMYSAEHLVSRDGEADTFSLEDPEMLHLTW